jgi:hypothetical protein
MCRGREDADGEYLELRHPTRGGRRLSHFEKFVSFGGRVGMGQAPPVGGAPGNFSHSATWSFPSISWCAASGKCHTRGSRGVPRKRLKKRVFRQRPRSAVGERFLGTHNPFSNEGAHEDTQPRAIGRRCIGSSGRCQGKHKQENTATEKTQNTRRWLVRSRYTILRTTTRQRKHLLTTTIILLKENRA